MIATLWGVDDWTQIGGPNLAFKTMLPPALPVAVDITLDVDM